MSVAKRIGANRQAEIDMRNARINAILTSKPVVYTGYAIAGTVAMASLYVMMCCAIFMDQGIV